DLENGRDAFHRRAWADAYQSLSRADAHLALDLDDVERLARASALTGPDADFLRLLQRGYHASLASGQEERAGRNAFWLCMRLYAMGEAARAGGWLARAQRLVGARDCVERGYLMIPAIHRHHAAAEHAAAVALATQAAAV